MTSRSVTFGSRSVSGNICKENQDNLCTTIFLSENRAIYDIMWKKCCRAGEATDDNIIRRMRFVCCISKGKNIHSEYVIYVAFPRQQTLRERAINLLYGAMHASFFFFCLQVFFRIFSAAVNT